MVVAWVGVDGFVVRGKVSSAEPRLLIQTKKFLFHLREKSEVSRFEM